MHQYYWILDRKSRKYMIYFGLKVKDKMKQTSQNIIQSKPLQFTIKIFSQFIT